MHSIDELLEASPDELLQEIAERQTLIDLLRGRREELLIAQQAHIDQAMADARRKGRMGAAGAWREAGREAAKAFKPIQQALERRWAQEDAWAGENALMRKASKT